MDEVKQRLECELGRLLNEKNSRLLNERTRQTLLNDKT